MDPQLDSMSHALGTGDYQLRGIKKKIYQCQLVNVWRAQHPREWGYTFDSLVHDTYSRLDYILVEHRFLETVEKSSIEIASLSDHTPVTVKLRLWGTKNRINTWRLNEDLIQDIETGDKIKK